MKILNWLFSRDDRGVKRVRSYSRSANTRLGTVVFDYSIYRAKTTEEAVRFLQRCKLKMWDRIIVETPDGAWGKGWLNDDRIGKVEPKDGDARGHWYSIAQR